jgi:hypothetical protein
VKFTWRGYVLPLTVIITMFTGMPFAVTVAENSGRLRGGIEPLGSVSLPT